MVMVTVGVASLIDLDYGHPRDPRWPIQNQDGVWIDSMVPGGYTPKS